MSSGLTLLFLSLLVLSCCVYFSSGDDVLVSSGGWARHIGGVNDFSDFHLLVTSAVELGAVFMNVLRDGFEHSLMLPSSHMHDSVLCSVVADLDWDGRNELILGTYGKQILAYRFDENDRFTSAELIWRKSFSHPIHSLWYGDLTGDGVSELAVLSMGGLHLLQHNLDQVSELCLKRAEDMLRKQS